MLVRLKAVTTRKGQARTSRIRSERGRRGYTIYLTIFRGKRAHEQRRCDDVLTSSVQGKMNDVSGGASPLHSCHRKIDFNKTTHQRHTDRHDIRLSTTVLVAGKKYGVDSLRTRGLKKSPVLVLMGAYAKAEKHSPVGDPCATSRR